MNQERQQVVVMATRRAIAAFRRECSPPPVWTVLPPAGCPAPARCAECRTLHEQGRECPWCHPTPRWL